MKYKKFSKWCALIALILTAGTVFSPCADVSAAEKEITIAIGMSLPPYVMLDDTGFEIDIIRTALMAKGYRKVNFKYLPNLRIPAFFKDKKVDGIAANTAYDIGKHIGMNVYSTDTTIFYMNYAIALENKNFTINSIGDLVDKKVIAFQNATRYLGTEFASMAEKNIHYEENANQSYQVNRLFKNRTDVVISDKKIFQYWRLNAFRKGILKPHDVNQSIQFYPIFPPAPRNCTFYDEKIRDDFNEGLKIIHQNGTYDIILTQYMNN